MHLFCVFVWHVLLVVFNMAASVDAEDVVGCGGFVQSDVEINYSLIEMKLYTKQGIMKHKTECAPNNGYFLIPLYDKGTFVLKIEPPSGWSFEPSSVELNIDGTTDKCSKGEDINFIFTGFSLTGKVLSLGRNEGPSGVDITLAGKASERKTATTEGGLFIFTRVMPGNYKITASHTTWTFTKAQGDVTVKDGSVEVSDTIVVAGYDVKGHVLSDGQPINGVQFLLFSKTNEAKEVSGCDPIPSSVLKDVQTKSEAGAALCQVKSGSDGTFTFPSVPSGDYILVPFYQGEHITFDVVPTKLTFTVNYKSVVLKTPFQVHGFSVMGKVLSAEGKGISGVTVTATNDKPTTTTAEGVYVLENITTGSYTIQASKTDYFFDALHVQVTPNTPKLPDIKPAGYHLCGKLSIDVFPPGVTQLSGRKMILQTEGAPISTRSMSAKVDASGNFCFKVAPGLHIIQPVISASEQTAGLVLKPKEQRVQVVTVPVTDVLFTQFRATVTGRVKCIGGSCKGVTVSLSPTTSQSHNKMVATVSDAKTGATFTFQNVLPGHYKATVVQEMWCWQNRSLDFTITESDVTSLEFIQSGFILKCKLSHAITLYFSLEGKKEVVGSFTLAKGTNRFCLAEPGIYNLTPKSCHRFEQEVYKYDTSSPAVLTLTAVKHWLSGVVSAEEHVKDIRIKIRSLKTKEVIMIGPMTSSIENIAGEAVVEKERPKDGNNTASEKNTKQQAPTGQTNYNFSHWGRLGEDFEITPLSSLLLFYPPVKTVTITDGCPGVHVELEGRRGVFLEGEVAPPLAGVEITITSESTGSEEVKPVIKILSDEHGKYRVGPLHGGITYNMAAQKSGFIITPVAERKGHFQAFKLGEIRIKVTDEEEAPLTGVLLSLSAGQFRSNNLTTEGGTMVFGNLGPGQYYFRPMLKEYTFIPATQMIDVAEGATVDIGVKGKRVAFSCYGMLTSLNGEPQRDIAVEAVGMDSCEGMQEETRSDKDGSYRLRGLQPGCSYRVRVKTGDNNPHISRASPGYIDVQVSGSDVKNVNIIVFRRRNEFDITGNVVTNREHLHTLKVMLYRENNLESPVLTTSVGVANYFQFPPVPNDGQVYIVRLDSSLSNKNYEYNLPETTVTATGIRDHVTLNFTPTSRRFEPEPSQGSLLAIPLLVLLVVLAMNHTKILPMVQQAAQVVQGAPADQLQVPVDDPMKNRRKLQTRRR